MGALRALRQTDDHRAFGARGHRGPPARRRRTPPRCRPPRILGTIRPAVAARVEGDDAGVPREIVDLRLPAAGVHDRPGRQEEEGDLTFAERLPMDAHAVALDLPLSVGLSRCAAWFALVRVLLPLVLVHVVSCSSDSIRCVDPRQHGVVSFANAREALELEALAEGHDQRDQRFQRQSILDAVLGERASEGFPQHLPPHSALTLATPRSRRTGLFHPIACSSAQILL